MTKLNSKRVKLANISIKLHEKLINKQQEMLKELAKNNKSLHALLLTKDTTIAELQETINSYKDYAINR